MWVAFRCPHWMEDVLIPTLWRSSANIVEEA